MVVVPFQYNRDLSINYWIDPFTGQQSQFYDPFNPRTKIAGFILNFDSFDGTGKLIEDGKDSIYGDKGNDIIFGGTGQDRLWGGQGDDYLQLDDNLNTDGGLNNNTDDATTPLTTAGAGDFAYGGDGLDVLIANTGYDRMFDWGGEFNSFIVPFARFGSPTVNRSPNPHIVAFLNALSASGGADPGLTNPNSEPAIFTHSDPEWHENHGAPRDPQPGNYPQGNYDASGSPEDDTLLAPLQTSAGSTPTSGRPPHGGSGGPGPGPGDTDFVQITKAVNAANPLNPTTAEDANDPLNPRMFAVGTNIVWTYLVTNPGTHPVTITSIVDDGGSSSDSSDDFIPVYVSGDSDNDGLLDRNETWLFTSSGVVSYQAEQGLYGNFATVTVRDTTGTTGSANDAAYHQGTVPSLFILKAINAANPMMPTQEELAQNAPGRYLPVGTPVVWTYQVYDFGDAPVSITAITDNMGTVATGDDFVPAHVYQAGTTFNVGDTNRSGLLDPGEMWLFTSAGVKNYTVIPGQYSNTVTVSGVDLGLDTTITDTNTNYHFGVDSKVRVKKAVNAANPNNPTPAEDADFAPGRLLPIGNSVVWTYQIFNDGNVPLTLQSLRDDFGTPGDLSDDFTPAYISGDADNDGLIDPGEVWLYSSAIVRPYMVIAGQYVNTATIVTRDPAGQSPTSSDAAYHFGNRAGLLVKKAVNAANPANPTTAEDADTIPGRFVAVGTPVIWTYLVSNTGEFGAELTINEVRDDAGTPGNASDDFTAAPILVGGFNVGDTDHDGKLDVGETWRYTSAGVRSYTVVAGQYSNLGRAIATRGDGQSVMDDDPANHFGAAPNVRVVKAVNAVNPNNPTAIEDANAAPGPAFVNGTAIVWTYQIFNTGNVPLTLITLRDDNGTTTTSDDFTPAPVLSGGFNVGDANQNNRLDTTEVWLFTSQGVKSYAVKAGQYRNIGTVTMTSPDTLQTVTASDANYHYGQKKGEGLTPGFWKNNADNFAAVAWPRNTSDGRNGEFVYAPSQTLSSVFPAAANYGLGNLTLVDALNLQGGGANALLRHSVAALLSAVHPRVAYPLTTRQVIDQVNAALISGIASQIEALKNTLESHNSLGSDLDQHGNTSGPQLAASLPSKKQPSVSWLTAQQLAPVVEAAKARWIAQGASLESLANVRITIADLPDGSASQLPVIGYTTNEVFIDGNAGGFGWYVDTTPNDDREFRRTGNSFALQAPIGSVAAGRIDLLSVVIHELGHVLGLADLTPGATPDLMDATLSAGTRRLPGRPSEVNPFGATNHVTAFGFNSKSATPGLLNERVLAPNIFQRQAVITSDRKKSTNLDSTLLAALQPVSSADRAVNVPVTRLTGERRESVSTLNHIADDAFLAFRGVRTGTTARKAAEMQVRSASVRGIANVAGLADLLIRDQNERRGL